MKFLFISFDADTLANRFGNKGTNENTELEKPSNLNKKKKSPQDILDLVFYIIELIKAILGELVRYARLNFCKIKISIGCDEADKTAILYGTVSSLLYTALEFIDTIITTKKNYINIGVVPDFTSSECSADIKVIIKIRII